MLYCSITNIVYWWSVVLRCLLLYWGKITSSPPPPHNIQENAHPRTLLWEWLDPPPPHVSGGQCTPCVGGGLWEATLSLSQMLGREATARPLETGPDIICIYIIVLQALPTDSSRSAAREDIDLGIAWTSPARFNQLIWWNVSTDLPASERLHHLIFPQYFSCLDLRFKSDRCCSCLWSITFLSRLAL